MPPRHGKTPRRASFPGNGKPGGAVGDRRRGFSAGGYVGLGRLLGEPKEKKGMIEFLCHEFTHSWVLPHPEVWNEPIATYVGDVVMGDLGYPEEGKRRIENTIRRASTLTQTRRVRHLRQHGTPRSRPAGRRQKTKYTGASRSGSLNSSAAWTRSSSQILPGQAEICSPPEWTTAITWMTP